jgi:hypothetical protein
MRVTAVDDLRPDSKSWRSFLAWTVQARAKHYLDAPTFPPVRRSNGAFLNKYTRIIV